MMYNEQTCKCYPCTPLSTIQHHMLGARGLYFPHLTRDMYSRLSQVLWKPFSHDELSREHGSLPTESDNFYQFKDGFNIYNDYWPKGIRAFCYFIAYEK